MHWKVDKFLTDLSYFIERFIPIRPRTRTSFKPVIKFFLDNYLLDEVAEEIVSFWYILVTMNEKERNECPGREKYLDCEKKMILLVQRNPKIIRYLGPYTRLPKHRKPEGGIEYTRWCASLGVTEVIAKLDEMFVYSRPPTK